MTVRDLPTVNAILNSIAAAFLLAGWVAIKFRHRQTLHRNLMIGALTASGAFLATYLYYHAQVGSVPYQKTGVLRGLYFFILIPHIILAALMVPFILLALWHVYRQRYEAHARVTRWVWPVWMYVSVTGVMVYLMLYVF
jgi:putative membrane protein